MLSRKGQGSSPNSGASRASWVYDTLRSNIQSGRYAHGARIRENDVALELGVSRTPVREALARLQARSLLEISPSGLVVAQLSRPQIVELYAMREILEGSAARFAAKHASPSEVGALQQIAARFLEHLDDPEALARINRDFHASIYEAAHNRFLLRTLEELHDHLALLPGTTFSVKGRPAAAMKEHAAMLKAIQRRDFDAAEKSARHHIEKAQEARLVLLSGMR